MSYIRKWSCFVLTMLGMTWGPGRGIGTLNAVHESVRISRQRSVLMIFLLMDFVLCFFCLGQTGENGSWARASERAKGSLPSFLPSFSPLASIRTAGGNVRSFVRSFGRMLLLPPTLSSLVIYPRRTDYRASERASERRAVGPSVRPSAHYRSVRPSVRSTYA